MNWEREKLPLVAVFRTGGKIRANKSKLLSVWCLQRLNWRPHGPSFFSLPVQPYPPPANWLSSSISLPQLLLFLPAKRWRRSSSRRTPADTRQAEHHLSDPAAWLYVPDPALRAPSPSPQPSATRYVPNLTAPLPV